VSWGLFGASAVALSLERLTYIWISRQPVAFRAWCGGRLPRTIGGPVEVVGFLFLGFKLVQLTTFAIWFERHRTEAIWPPPGGPDVLLAGLALIVIGQTLTLSAFARLGRIGVFYGRLFGHARVTCRAFPYSLMAHPQYVGAVLSIWGLFVLMRYPGFDWYFLPTLETAFYIVGGWLER
jgi:phosphatidyl-N-methylethanolamine N-methyltransferase